MVDSHEAVKKKAFTESVMDWIFTPNWEEYAGGSSERSRLVLPLPRGAILNKIEEKDKEKTRLLSLQLHQSLASDMNSKSLTTISTKIDSQK